MTRPVLLIALCTFAFAASAASMTGADKVRTMDTDKDGKVSAAEHAASAQKMFAMLDTDKDGALSPAEFDAADARMRTAQAERDKKAGGK